MAQRRLYLKDGVLPENAERTLRELVNAAAQAIAVGGGPGSIGRLRDEYLSWVEAAEAQVRSLTDDAELLTMFQTERYWRIRELHDGSTRPWPLIDGEVEMQKAALQQLVADLQERVARASAAPGAATFLDTNTLLEFQPPDQIPWARILGAREVRLVIPLRVIEELDAKKYVARRDLAQRARRLLPWLEEVLGPTNSGQIQSGVTIEVPIDAGPRRRRADADEEILDNCLEWRQLSGSSVRVVTADTGMRLRAQALRLEVVRLPSEFARVAANKPDTDVARVEGADGEVRH